MVFEINFDLLRKVRDNDRKCLCSLADWCPCNSMVDTGCCRCGVFIKKNINKKKMVKK